MAAPLNVRPPPEAQIGAGAVRLLGKQAKAMGARLAFVVTDKGLTAAGLTARVEGLLRKEGVDVAVFDGVSANPTMANVAAGIAALNRRFDGTVVVTLGGGSSMDAGKVIAATARDVAARGGGAEQYCMYTRMTPKGIDPRSLVPARVPEAPALPVIAIPTTSGTASETNGAAVLTDEAEHKKVIFSSNNGMARMALLDPEMTVGLPAYPTACCGMDALTHALEAFTSARANPYGDAIAYGAIALVAEWLPKLMADLRSVEARGKIQLASHMAGVAFRISGLGIIHAMGHPLGALQGGSCAHGQTLATLLPVLMEFNLPVRAAKYARVAEAFGVRAAGASDEENARRAIDAVSDLSARVGTAKSIEQLGGTEQQLAGFVSQAVSDVSLLSTPRMPTAADVEALYRKALRDPRLYRAKL